MKQIFEGKSVKRIAIRTPGGNLTYHYRKRKIKDASCSGCGAKLHGVPRLRTKQLAKLAKTKRRPERIFGGVLCPSCVEEKIKNKLMVTTNDNSSN